MEAIAQEINLDSNLFSRPVDLRQINGRFSIASDISLLVLDDGRLSAEVKPGNYDVSNFVNPNVSVLIYRKIHQGKGAHNGVYKWGDKTIKLMITFRFNFDIKDVMNFLLPEMISNEMPLEQIRLSVLLASSVQKYLMQELEKPFANSNPEHEDVEINNQKISENIINQFNNADENFILKQFSFLIEEAKA